MNFTLNLGHTEKELVERQLPAYLEENRAKLEQAIYGPDRDEENNGWRQVSEWADDSRLEEILQLAREVRRDGEVFVLAGVGGSNRGAQAVIEGLHRHRDGGLEIVYAGNNVSGAAMSRLLASLKGKSVYVNVVAKDFSTIEPAMAFRMLYRFLREEYPLQEANRRMILTGCDGQGQLHPLAQEQGFPFLPFPHNIGGRFTVLSPVGLFPMAVMGADIRALVRGALHCREFLGSTPLEQNPAALYAAFRALLYGKGYKTECLSCFEPEQEYFARWWQQLYGESEGKKDRGIFPSVLSYSEDLHAMGQYLQQGDRHVFETFLDLRRQNPEKVPAPLVPDGLDYLTGKDYDCLADAVYHGTLAAHRSVGVPIGEFCCGTPSEEVLGQLFYFFMTSCIASSALLGVDPYGQPGVEGYKQNMYRALGKIR